MKYLILLLLTGCSISPSHNYCLDSTWQNQTNKGSVEFTKDGIAVFYFDGIEQYKREYDCKDGIVKIDSVGEAKILSKNSFILNNMKYEMVKP